MRVRRSTGSVTQHFQIISMKWVPLLYLRLIQCYVSQKMGVKWANRVSSSFSVMNGVRQAGNLSPLLFNVYIDELLDELKTMNVGCHIHVQPVNVLAYADDIVLLSPSSAGMVKLIDKCEKFAMSRDIKFNAKKTVCMPFSRHCS